MITLITKTWKNLHKNHSMWIMNECSRYEMVKWMNDEKTKNLPSSQIPVSRCCRIFRRSIFDVQLRQLAGASPGQAWRWFSGARPDDLRTTGVGQQGEGGQQHNDQDELRTADSSVVVVRVVIVDGHDCGGGFGDWGGGGVVCGVMRLVKSTEYCLIDQCLRR